MENVSKKIFYTALLLLIALVSCMFLGDKASSVETHQETIVAIDDKVETVLKLTATSTIASAGVSAIPGDTATPIAEKLADFSEYFLLILCVLYAEKYLITILGAASFKLLIPIACVMLAIAFYKWPGVLRKIAVKLIAVALVLYVVIPASVKVSDMIYLTYQESINQTISSAEELSDDTAAISSAAGNESVISQILEKLSETKESLTDRAANILNRFIETLAVIIVTSCIIPILVLLFFLWLIRMVTGIDVSAYMPPHGPKRHGIRKALKSAGKTSV
jgi:hypothetical protein